MKFVYLHQSNNVNFLETKQIIEFLPKSFRILLGFQETEHTGFVYTCLGKFAEFSPGKYLVDPGTYHSFSNAVLSLRLLLTLLLYG